MSLPIESNSLVVRMPTKWMTGNLLRSQPGDELAVFGWRWKVVDVFWEGTDESIKSVILVRTDGHISPAEAIQTNCYPITRE
jgi:hypothetical protein